MARKSRKNLVPIAESQPKQLIYNAGAYIRLSGDARTKPGDSLRNQQNIIENFIAASPDIRLTEIYSDNSATGTNFERPSFQKMLSDAESGVINCIIVKDLSRFGRNAIDSGYYLEKYLPQLGVRFIAVTDSYDSNEGDGGIMLPLKNIIAESYALDISRKCKAVQRQNIRDGKFVGRMAPYGFSKAENDCRKLVIDPEAADVVRQIFKWALLDMSVGEIVRALNDAGIMPPSHYKLKKGIIAHERLVGKPYWQKRTVVDMLCDRVYVGDMVQGKTKTINHKEVAVDPSQWVCVSDTHEPIVTREIFGRVQELRGKASERDRAVRSPAVPYSPHVFKGKVFCAHCGHPMHRHRQNKDGVYWYRCQSQHRFSKDACYQVSVKEEELRTEVISLLHKYAEAILGNYVCRERRIPRELADAEIELNDINRQLNDSGHFLKSLYENLVEELISSEEFTAMKADYEEKIITLGKRADEIRNWRREQKEEFKDYFNFADAVSAALYNRELSEEIIGVLVEKILVSRDKSFEIVLAFRNEFMEVSKVG